ncbi:MAG TPA: YcgL domain-containing protein [Cellvibrionaceae bacterium]
MTESTAPITKHICDVYKSAKKDELYLYVLKTDGLTRVPELLLEHFGAPKHCLTLVLTVERKLARTSGQKVLEAIAEQGFYLQMPPQTDDEMKRINQHNSKLYGL